MRLGWSELRNLCGNAATEHADGKEIIAVRALRDICPRTMPCSCKFPKQCSHCRGSGGDSGTGRLLRRRFGRLRPSTFVRRRGTSCMLPRSRAGEKVGRATFFRKTQWFQHIFPLSTEGGPDGSRDAPDAFRGLLGIPPELSERPQSPFWDPSSRILLKGFLL